MELDNLHHADGEKNYQTENQTSAEEHTEKEILKEGVESFSAESKVEPPLESSSEEISSSVEELITDGSENSTIQEKEVEQPTSEVSEELKETAKTEETDVEAKAVEETQDVAEGDSVEEVQEPKERPEEIPEKNYVAMPMESLVDELKALVSKYPVLKIKQQVRNVREEFFNKLNAEEEALKKSFIEEGGNAIDFFHQNPLKAEFGKAYGEYKKQLEFYFKTREKQEDENLKVRERLIEELKALYTEPQEDNRQLFQKYKEIKDQWNKAGRISKSHASRIFPTYFHHLDNFHEFLNFNKDLREMDYAHNLDMRRTIIERAKELMDEPIVQKALNELQYLHKKWKEEAVPVADEFREITWQEFKELTNKIHERREELSEKIHEEQQANLQRKQAIIIEIKGLATEEKVRHGEWQRKIKQLNKLREEFLAIGRVPKEVNQPTWDAFKEATRNFNHKKNEFYKGLKEEQQNNLNEKQKLLDIAHKHKDSEEWQETIEIFKKIQRDWKNIGHVPRKVSDKIWKEFTGACDHFFERYKSRNEKFNEQFEANFEKKEELLKTISQTKPSKDAAKDIETMNQWQIQWTELGKVPRSKMSIQNDFNKAITAWAKSAGISEEDIKEMKQKAMVEEIKGNNDYRKQESEVRKLRSEIDGLEKELNQLERNLNFFSNADENNPMLKDAYDKIRNKREQHTEKVILLKQLLKIDFEENNQSVENTSEE